MIKNISLTTKKSLEPKDETQTTWFPMATATGKGWKTVLSLRWTILMPTVEPVLRWAILRFRRRLHIVSNSVVIFNFNQNQANTLSFSEWVSSHDPQGDRVRKNVFVSRQIKEIRGAYECSCWPKAWSMKQNFHGAAPRPSSVLVVPSRSVRTAWRGGHWANCRKRYHGVPLSYLFCLLALTLHQRIYDKIWRSIKCINLFIY